MNIFRILLFSISVTLYSCGGGNETPPKFSFKTQTGYTFKDDTVPVNTSIKFGIKAEKGGSKMETYTISVRYDNGSAIQPQSPFMPTKKEQTEFSRDTTIITRATPGTEEWIFNVRDKNGNSSQRNIKLKVE